jgi:hypothetical protein
MQERESPPHALVGSDCSRPQVKRKQSFSGPGVPRTVLRTFLASLAWAPAERLNNFTRAHHRCAARDNGSKDRARAAHR